MRALLDLVAPISCVHCGADSDGELCSACAADVKVLAAPICERCGTPADRDRTGCPACADLGGFRRARSLVVFAEPARELTLALKRGGRGELARSVGELMADLAAAQGLRGDVVTYVPAPRKARARGFDHAALIAAAVACALSLPMRRLLERASDGPRQADVPFAQRRSNVRGRFRARRRVPDAVLLVDDVFTTGATAEACADALRQAGARSVDVVTWARTIRRSRSANRP